MVLFAWNSPDGTCRDLMAPGSALHTRPEVRVSRLEKLVPASRIRPPVHIPSLARPVPALLSRSPVRLHGLAHPMPPPHTSPQVAAPRTRLPVRVLGQVPPVPAPRISAAGAFLLSSAAGVSRLFGAARSPAPQSRGARAPHSRGARAFLSSVAGASRLPSAI